MVIYLFAVVVHASPICSPGPSVLQETQCKQALLHHLFMQCVRVHCMFFLIKWHHSPILPCPIYNLFVKSTVFWIFSVQRCLNMFRYWTGQVFQCVVYSRMLLIVYVTVLDPHYKHSLPFCTCIVCDVCCIAELLTHFHPTSLSVYIVCLFIYIVYCPLFPVAMLMNGCITLLFTV